MPSYVVTYTDAEQKAMEYISTDVDFWIQNACHERARLAQEELVADTIKAKLDAGLPIPGPTKEDIAMASDLPNAKQRNEAMLELARAGLPTTAPD